MSAFDGALQQITGLVWDTTLSLPLVEEDPFRLAHERGEILAGVVRISGNWDGAVAVQCTRRMAAKLARVMFSLDGADPGTGEIRDALGEVGNMVGGNFKALLEEPNVLSIPEIHAAEDFRLHIPGMSQILQAAFRSEDEPIAVSVFQKD